MIVPNFAAVPAHAICRPVTWQCGDEYYWMRKIDYANTSLTWDVWSGRWQVDVRATKKAKGISKKTDK